jgi:hypothetical protein
LIYEQDLSMGISQKRIWLIMLVFVAGILLAGCTLPQEPGPQTISKNPFSLRMQGEDGKLLELSGNSRGHMPGSEAAFDIRLVNQGLSTWRGEYCVQLVDESGVVSTFEQNEFNLESGEALFKPLRIMIPDDLAEGVYGLGIDIPERWTSTTTIYLGNVTDRSAGPFAEPDCP